MEKSYVIRSKSGMQFESCEIGKVGQEETYSSMQQAEFALAQIQSCFPFEVFEISEAD